MDGLAKWVARWKREQGVRFMVLLIVRVGNRQDSS